MRRLLLTFTTAAAMCLGGVRAVCAQSEEFYALAAWSVIRLDTTTGAAVGAMTATPPPDQLFAFTHDGTRLVGVDRASFGHPDRFYTIHPASAEAVIGPWTGYQWNNLAIEWIPQLGGVFVVYGSDVFRIDASLGTVSYQGALVGLDSLDGVAAMTVHPNGSLYGVGFLHGNGVISLYELDLTAMTATWLGYLNVPFGHFYDLACNSSGIIWGTFASWGAPSATGLYTLDPATMAVTQRQALQYTYVAIAFGPAMPGSSYCQGKLGSIGCVPTCEWAGLGSPTASWGLDISASNVISQSRGSLYYGLGQPATLPFGGGTLCIRGPLGRAGLVWSGGSSIPSCDGVWTIDFNEWMASHVSIPAGTTVRAQWLGRDPGFAPPANWQMSNALEFVLRP